MTPSFKDSAGAGRCTERRHLPAAVQRREHDGGGCSGRCFIAGRDEQEKWLYRECRRLMFILVFDGVHVGGATETIMSDDNK